MECTCQYKIGETTRNLCIIHENEERRQPLVDRLIEAARDWNGVRAPCSCPKKCLPCDAAVALQNAVAELNGFDSAHETTERRGLWSSNGEHGRSQRE